MITEQDLQEAIAECKGERHPNAQTCIKLAAYYTIKENLYPDRKVVSDTPGGYTAQAPIKIEQPREKEEKIIGEYGESEFLRLLFGKSADKIWNIMNELMETLTLTNPRLYDAVISKLKQI